MKNISHILEQLLADSHLDAASMREVLQACIEGQITDSQLAAFLVLMRKKGETVEELAAAAEIMMEKAEPIDLGDNLLDIVGTGGDKKNTFNISTLSSLVAAAAGARVAKQGNRAVSSSSGSADLLIKAGFHLELNTNQLKTCMDRYNFCFLLAPQFHQAMQALRPVRQQLGLRTFFNLLGPLINPARVKKQLVGVFDKRWQEPLAQVLVQLGSEHVLVVSSDDGLDEISIAAKTRVIEYKSGCFSSWVIDPACYDCYHPSLEPITVDSAESSLTLIQEVLAAKLGPARDVVLLNTAAALYAADLVTDLEAGLEKAAFAIDSGKALARFNQLRDFRINHA